MEKFSPIAIVGRSCALPGASSPEELWQVVSEQRSVIGHPAKGRWRIGSEKILSSSGKADFAWSDLGGHVGEGPRWRTSTSLSLDSLDPLFHWVLHSTEEALSRVMAVDRSRTGAIFGNLSFPSEGLSAFAERQWLQQSIFDQDLELPNIAHQPINRFMSGYPVMLLSQLGLEGPLYALDAACASGLVALKHACEVLHDGRADVMIAGGVNRADDLFIHVGFCALQALSRSGQSRPFHADADGLLPAEGVVAIALKRLADAERDGDDIVAVIRGIGTSNDGRSRGLLAPAECGQIEAMQRAYHVAGLSPDQISFIECHATGTPVGDATELRSMAKVFGKALPIGSLKANMGHSITVAGLAGVLKVCSALEHEIFPPNLPIDQPHPAVAETGFRLLQSAEPWTGPRRAGVSAFGFGGNNAHVIIEAYEAGLSSVPTGDQNPVLAVVGVDLAVGDAADRLQVWQRLQRGEQLNGMLDSVTLSLKSLCFPPNDLKQSLGQQLLVLHLAQTATAELNPENLGRVGVWVGLGADPEVCRYGLRWRIAELMGRLTEDPAEQAQQIRSLREQVIPELEAAGVLGTMPNIPANRINAILDARGGSGTVSAEEASGLVALEIALRGLRTGELDTAIVGAVDLPTNKVHTVAAREVIGIEEMVDAGAVLVLKRLADAIRSGDTIYGVVDTEQQPLRWTANDTIEQQLGHSHAAKGLVKFATATLHAAVKMRGVTSEIQDMSGRSWTHHIRPYQSTELHSSQLRQPLMSFPLHWRPLSLSLDTAKEGSSSAEQPFEVSAASSGWLRPAPQLPSLLANSQRKLAADLPSKEPPLTVNDPANPSLAEPVQVPQYIHQNRLSSDSALAVAWMEEWSQLTAQHDQFLEQQQQSHQQFLLLQQELQSLLMGSLAGPSVDSLSLEEQSLMPQQVEQPVTSQSSHSLASPSVVAVEVPVQPEVIKQPITPHRVPNQAPKAVGLTLSREQLKIHSSGQISEIYGPQFVDQDAYGLQCRMPEPPLLLADRVTGLAAEPATMKTGTIWTETDVGSKAWYLHCDRMPAGILIESGQADLMLISYLGIDLLTQGERAYRLLGCELMYHDDLPKVGDTLCYDIHVNGHAKHGDVRLFFFHYDCRIAGQPMLSVRQGQAGFFTKKELEDSAGILWTPESQELRADARIDPPAHSFGKVVLSRSQVQAFAEGRPWQCFPTKEFGTTVLRTQTHTRTPGIHRGRMLFLNGSVELDHRGGPWSRGSLRCSVQLRSDEWYFDGHFLNDPCMPGTLMFEGCLQAMALYMAAMGCTADRDGWRFQPLRNRPYPLRCRGQVTPESQVLIYELFVEEYCSGPTPYLIADLLCTVDGRKAFHARAMGLELVPDYPLDQSSNVELQGLLSEGALADQASVIATDKSGFPFDYRAMLASALGKPSEAFGPMYLPFDGPRKVARLPGPPYHFMSRVSKVEGDLGTCAVGTKVTMAYDVPPQAWYFAANGARTMPFAVLLEAALQPCGWLASAVGSALTVKEELSFRNLDGVGIVHCEVLPEAGTFVTTVEITNISQSAGMIIESFEVECHIGSQLVYTLSTVFGFFPQQALENQIGLTTTSGQRQQLNPMTIVEDLQLRPARYFAGTARLASPMLCMIDRITGWDPKGGEHGLGWARAEKTVDPSEWFFKAHFFQDPVQPGSLGIEAMLQLLQWSMLALDLDHGKLVRFTPIALGHSMTWKYRGQVVPENGTITTTLEITEVGMDAFGSYALANASLWVDGKRIYEASGVGVQMVSGE